MTYDYHHYLVRRPKGMKNELQSPLSYGFICIHDYAFQVIKVFPEFFQLSVLYKGHF